MSKTEYKIWIQVERVNHDKGIYESVTEPKCEQERQALLESLRS